MKKTVSFYGCLQRLNFLFDRGLTFLGIVELPCFRRGLDSGSGELGVLVSCLGWNWKKNLYENGFEIPVEEWVFSVAVLFLVVYEPPSFLVSLIRL